MSMKYIPELGYELEGRSIELWEGTAPDRTLAQTEAYRKMMLARPKPGTTTAKPANGITARTKSPCVHLGEPTGDKVVCGPCGGNVQLKVLKCAVHRECTVAKKVDGSACCEGCKDYEPKDKPAEILQLSNPPIPQPPRVRPSITYHYPHVVYHVAEMGDCREVVCEQLYDLAAAGLVHIQVTVAGGSGDWIATEAGQRGIVAKIVARNPSLKVYESLALDEVYRFANSTEGIEGRPILYLHAKGVSAPGNAGKRAWRRVMMRHLVAKWKELWPLLDTHDAVGCNWMPTYAINGIRFPHFAGNFWLARADYIRSLPPWEAWWRKRGHERFSCESWIGANAACRPLSLLATDAGWGNDAPENFTPFLEKS